MHLDFLATVLDQPWTPLLDPFISFPCSFSNLSLLTPQPCRGEATGQKQDKYTLGFSSPLCVVFFLIIFSEVWL